MTTAAPAAPAVQQVVEPIVEPVVDDSVRPVQRFVWVPVETAPVPAGPSDRLRGRTVAVLGGTPDGAAAVVAALGAAGATAYHLPAPAGPEPDAAASVAAFRAGVPVLDGIVDLNLDQPFDLTGPPGWSVPFEQTIALLQSCYADWVTETDAERLFYLAVTRMGGRMGFGDRPEQPLGGLWAGLAKGLPREIPNCNIRILDVAAEHTAGLPAIIAAELYRWGVFEVGYRGGRRHTLVARAEPVPAPRLALRPGDVVAMSGGGRGIGFALARGLAGDFGCRVLVSGRAAAPDPAAEPALTMSEADYRRYRDARLVEAAAARTLARTRAELNKLTQARELWTNLSAARAEGLDIEYQSCDITDAEQVVRLLDRAGDRLVGVVHNAGIDLPTRLPGKVPATVRTVVGVKIDGFVTLARAVAGRAGVAFFCNVGSMTGRWGGMVGQLDYGAANEGLSRLGLWAEQSGSGGPAVTTVCWPTWRHLGMITNYEATLRYMSALDVGEGVEHWENELRSGSGGEITFIGEVGSAMLPTVLRGYPQDTGLPEIEKLVSARFLLGEPVAFAPYRAIATVNELSAETMPCCDDVRVDGEPALPVSLALAYLTSIGDWVLPEDWSGTGLIEARDVRVSLAGLRAGGRRSRIRLDKRGEGRYEGGDWRVDAVIDRDGVELARATLLYAASPRPLSAAPPPAATSVRSGGPARLSWSGHVLRMAAWHRADGTGEWSAEVAPDHLADLTTDGPTVAALPVNLLENVVRAAHLAGPGDELLIDSLELRGYPGAGPVRLLGSADARQWTGTDPAGDPCLRVGGLRFSTPVPEEHR